VAQEVGEVVGKGVKLDRTAAYTLSSGRAPLQRGPYTDARIGSNAASTASKDKQIQSSNSFFPILAS
jgi:hypothetical protein